MRLYPVFAAALFVSSVAVAQPDIEVTGKKEQVVQITPSNKQNTLSAQPSLKTITLMDINLSQHAWDKLSSRVSHIQVAETSSATPICPQGYVGCINTQLGMNGVPVLNQGRHGSCATFANTAALDAAMGRGDYISQLCHLQLGSRLELVGYNPSGWDGSLGPTVLNQMQSFGIVSKDKQHSSGCGDMYDYPIDNTMPEHDMSLEEYHALSEPLPDSDVAWTSILDVYQVFMDKTDPNQTLDAVKNSLKHKDRLTFGVLLFGLNDGTAGAVAKHHAKNDTWVLTPEITEAILKRKNFGGHEMIITGFNDYATAVDKDGRIHRGLLTIRNSWGGDIGDKGDFYMSYDYFKLLTIEVQRIRSF